MWFGKYASRKAEAKYPSLWDGLVGAWCPSVTGPTGVRLFDLSGKNNQGTLTNMDAATDWLRPAGRYALDYDGSDDSVSLNAPSGLTGSHKTLFIRVTFNSLGVNQFLIDAATHPSFGFNPSLRLTTSNIVRAWNYDATFFADGSTTIATGVAYTIAMTWDRSNTRVYVNGLLDAVRAGDSSTLAATSNWRIGRSVILGGAPNALIHEAMIYNRVLAGGELRLMTGIHAAAFHPKPKQYFGVQTATPWLYANRSRQIIGGGLG